MNKNHVSTILKAFKKDAISEEEAIEVLLEMGRNSQNTFTHPIIYSSSAKPVYYDTWQSYNTASRKDNGEMI